MSTQHVRERIEQSADPQRGTIPRTTADGLLRACDQDDAEDLTVLLSGPPEPPEPSPPPPAAQPHPMKVTLSQDGTEVEYDLKHPGCVGYTTHNFEIASGDDHTWMSRSFDCGVANMIDDGGFLSAIGVEGWRDGATTIEHLAPGDYVVEYWSRRYPSTPNGPEEWDTGLYVEPVT